MQSDMEQSDFIPVPHGQQDDETDASALAAAGKLQEYLGRAGNRLSAGARLETETVFAVLLSAAIRSKPNCPDRSTQQAARTVYQSVRGCIICTDETTGYKLTETGVEPFNVAAGICRLTDNGMTVTQNCTADETVLTAYN